jgi:hypothetical protein
MVKKFHSKRETPIHHFEFIDARHSKSQYQINPRSIAEKDREQTNTAGGQGYRF